MNRAYSALHVKEFKEDVDFVYLKGIASTPTLDSAGDIVNPMGASFQTPMPLLWQHKNEMPVGHVTFAKPTRTGIPFEARIPLIKEAGELKNRVDLAIHSLKYKLVAFVSIGFSAVEGAVKRLDGGGLHFEKWIWRELSLVTIPAQSEAVITSVKSLSSTGEPAQLTQALITQIKKLDHESLAASGTKRSEVVPIDSPPGESGTKKQPASGGFFYARLKGKEDMKTFSEQIKALEENLEATKARQIEIQTKAISEGRAKDGAERTQFEECDRDIEEFQKELVDLKKLEAINLAKATTISVTPGAGTVSTRLPVNVKNTQKLDPGIALARYARCLLLAEGSKHGAAQIAKNQYPEMDWMVGMLDAEVGGLKKEQMFMQKAAVAGGNTTDATWAAPLVQYQQYAQDFVEYLRPQMLIGKFGQNGVPALRRVPFNVTISGQTSGASAGWVGEAAPKPVTKVNFANVNLRWAKIAGITVISDELARMSTPGAEGLLRDEMARAVIERADIDFIDPDKAAVSNVSPASIVNGVTPVASAGGSSAAEIRADIRALFASWISGNVNPANAVFIMSPGNALALSLMYNDLDSAKVFPNVNMNGGTLEGIPVIVSQYAANDGGSAGSLVILANASDIFLSEDAGVDIAVSREASIQMNDAPDNPATASTVFTSMFQTNQLAIRSELFINWAKRRSNAVAWLDSVSWGV